MSHLPPIGASLNPALDKPRAGSLFTKCPTSGQLKENLRKKARNVVSSEHILLAITMNYKKFFSSQKDPRSTTQILVANWVDVC